MARDLKCALLKDFSPSKAWVMDPIISLTFCIGNGNVFVELRFITWTALTAIYLSENENMKDFIEFRSGVFCQYERKLRSQLCSTSKNRSCPDTRTNRLMHPGSEYAVAYIQYSGFDHDYFVTVPMMSALYTFQFLPEQVMLLLARLLGV